jgi:hypothetical protein
MRTQMTLKEMKHLTQKQIRALAVGEFPNAKIPKKWTDKSAALTWYEKNRKGQPASEVKPTKAAKTKPAAAKKPKVKKEVQPSAGKSRRVRIFDRLLTEQCTAQELASYENVQYKAILDDVHAIRHARGGVDLLKGKVLAGTLVGRNKVFYICSEAKLESQEKKIVEETEIVE